MLDKEPNGLCYLEYICVSLSQGLFVQFIPIVNTCLDVKIIYDKTSLVVFSLGKSETVVWCLEHSETIVWCLCHSGTMFWCLVQIVWCLCHSGTMVRCLSHSEKFLVPRYILGQWYGTYAILRQ